MRRTALLLAAGAFIAWPAAAQSPAHDGHRGDAFVHAARIASAKYEDRNSAIRAGYRRIGLSFPAMGEHWIQSQLLVGGVIDSTRPSLLSYVMVRGHPVLAGVGWAVVVDSSSRMPRSPVPKWHQHGGTLGDASFGGVHASSGAVLHAWVNVPNPAGTFETDNWTLPWVSAGLAPPAHPDPDAARALSLVSDGPEFWQEWLRWRGRDPDILTPATDSVRVLLAHDARANVLEPQLNALWQHWAGKLGLPQGKTEGH